MKAPFIEPDYLNIADVPMYAAEPRLPSVKVPLVKEPYFLEAPKFLQLCIDYLCWIESLNADELKTVAFRHLMIGMVGPDNRRKDTFTVTLFGRSLSVHVMIDTAEWQNVSKTFDAQLCLYRCMVREVRLEAERKLNACY